jgi:hypothetical protein
MTRTTEQRGGVRVTLTQIVCPRCSQPSSAEASEHGGFLGYNTKRCRSWHCTPEKGLTIDGRSATPAELVEALSVYDRTPRSRKALAQAVADQTADAFSFDRYASWATCAEKILARGFTVKETEAILRSKWMRWAADACATPYGRVPAAAIVQWLDGYDPKTFERDLAELVAGTFEGAL